MSRILALKNRTKNNEIYNHGQNDDNKDKNHMLGPTGCKGPTGCVGPTGYTYKKEILNLETKTTHISRGVGLSTHISGNLSVNGEISCIKNYIISRKKLMYPIPDHVESTENNITGLNICCSYNGQYVSICASGCIYVSNDYGISFTNNVIDCVGYAIAMCFSGKYQCCVSTGVPQFCILCSSDYGIMWTKTYVASSSLNKWTQTVSLSPNGQYIYCGCGGDSKDGALCYSSNDYGTTFRYGKSGNCKDSSVVSNDGYVLTAGVGGPCFYTNLNNQHNDPPILHIGLDTGPISLSHSVENEQWALVTSEGLYISKNKNGRDIIKVTPPAQFRQVQYSKEVVWARSMDSVWCSNDDGNSWKIVYTGNPRTLAASQDGTILYIVSNSGDIITRRIQESKFFVIGYTLSHKTSKVPFINTKNLITGTSILCIPPGVWSISFGWKMSAEGKLGNGQNYNVIYGLSKSSIGFDVLEVNGLYNIFYNDPTTFQSYYHNIVLVFTCNTSIFLNALLNNNSFHDVTEHSSIVDTTMINSYINATLISH